MAARHRPSRVRRAAARASRSSSGSYVNSCSQGALSDSVRAAYDDYLDGWDESGAPWEYWVERSEAARAAFARLVGAAPDDVAVTTSVSAGVSALASALDFTARREGRHHRLRVPDDRPDLARAGAARRRGRPSCPPTGRRSRSSASTPRSTSETALVSIAAVCYRNGARLAVEEITRLAHERGALVLLDAYQAIGTFPLDVRGARRRRARRRGPQVPARLGRARLHVDAPGLVEELVPTQTGWFADENIFEMDITDYSPSPTARRFQAGTPPVPNIYAGIAGMELMRGDRRRRDPGARPRAQRAPDRRGGRARAKVVTPRDAGAARRARLRPLDGRARARGRARRRRGSSPRSATSNLRISPHVYNTEDDVDARARRAAPRHRERCRRKPEPGSRLRTAPNRFRPQPFAVATCVADLTFYKTN